MYEILKASIEAKDYELSEMIERLHTAWSRGLITTEQMDELIELARENANPELSLEVKTLIKALEERVTKIEKRLEEGGQPPVEPEPDDEYPLFQPNHVYVKGDKVTFNGRKYKCILNEYTDRTTWGPGDYPAYWEEVKEKRIIPETKSVEWSKDGAPYDLNQVVSYKGKEWISTAESNTWEPGSYGWKEK